MSIRKRVEQIIESIRDSEQPGDWQTAVDAIVSLAVSTRDEHISQSETSDLNGATTGPTPATPDQLS